MKFKIGPWRGPWSVAVLLVQMMESSPWRSFLREANFPFSVGAAVRAAMWWAYFSSNAACARNWVAAPYRFVAMR